MPGLLLMRGNLNMSETPPGFDDGELSPHVRRVAAVSLSIPPDLPVVLPPPLPTLPVLPLPARSATVTTFAVLNIAFGAFAVLCGTPLGIAMVAMPQPGPFIEIMGNPVVRFVQYFGIGIALLNSMFLFASGVGLWKQRDWGRRLSVNCAVLAIVLNLVVTGLMGVLAVGPIFVVAQQRHAPEVWGAAFGMLGRVTIGGCCALLYPLFVIVFMRMDAVKCCLR